MGPQGVYRYLSCFLVYAIVGLAVPTVFGCGCQPTHPQQQFCNADAVIVGIVRSKQMVPDYPNLINYNVRVQMIKKGQQHIHQLWDAQTRVLGLNTTTTNNTCGVPWLEEKQRYVLTVMVENGEAFLYFCHFHRVYSQLTATQQRGINRAYGMGCAGNVQCQVHTCPNPNSCPLIPPNDTTCVHGYGQSYKDCYYHHGYCKLNSSGKCTWRTDSAFDVCFNEENQNS